MKNESLKPSVATLKIGKTWQGCQKNFFLVHARTQKLAKQLASV
jgi:hypothetical protein